MVGLSVRARDLMTEIVVRGPLPVAEDAVALRWTGRVSWAPGFGIFELNCGRDTYFASGS